MCCLFLPPRSKSRPGKAKAMRMPSALRATGLEHVRQRRQHRARRARARTPHELRPSATKLLHSVRGYTLSGQRKRWETELVDRVLYHRMLRYSTTLAFRCCRTSS